MRKIFLLFAVAVTLMAASGTRPEAEIPPCGPCPLLSN